VGRSESDTRLLLCSWYEAYCSERLALVAPGTRPQAPLLERQEVPKIEDLSRDGNSRSGGLAQLAMFFSNPSYSLKFSIDFTFQYEG